MDSQRRGRFEARLLAIGIAISITSIASAQLILDRGLEADPFVDLLTNPFADPTRADRLTIWSGFSDGFVSRQGGHVADLYQERSSGLSAATSIGRRFTVKVWLEHAASGGHYGGSSSTGQGSAQENDPGAEISFEADRNLRLFAGIDSTSVNLGVQSNLLGSTIPVLGTDPPIAVQEVQTAMPVGLQWKLGRRFDFGASLAPLLGSGQVEAGTGLPDGTIRVPLDPNGYLGDMMLRLHSGSDVYQIAGQLRNASHSGGLAVPGTTSGSSSCVERSQTLYLKAERKWSHRGTIAVHYENEASGDTIFASDPNAAGLGVAAPSGTNVTAEGAVRTRLSEVGLDWTSRTGLWGLSYRQVQAPFSVSGDYLGQYLFISEGQSGQAGLDPLDLGVLGCAYSVGLGSGRLTMSVQQLLPFSVKSISQTAILGGTGSHATTSAIGGTTLSVLLAFPRRNGS